MPKKDSKKDASQVEEVDLNTLIGADGLFDLGKIREKSILGKDILPSSQKKDISDHEEDEPVLDLDMPHEPDEHLLVEDDLPPLKDEDLLLLEDDLLDFEDVDMEEEDEEEEE